jgi:hypothetical protein
MKLKSFCTPKVVVTQFKRHPQNGRKSLPAIHLIRDSQNIQEAQKLNPQRIDDSIKKMGK